ncbi:MAG: Crp/Fnr family transcriptional regulator [Anaerolineae bacterium]|nr:Crp/Fnr family transcriptional regulator [Anaerolineae bacterium]
MRENEKEIIISLQSIPWYQELSPTHFEKMVKISELVEVDAKQELFREGDLQDYLYIVVKGRIAIEMLVPSRGRMRIYTAEPMDVVGWSSVTPVVRRRTAGASAVLPSCLIRQDAAALRKLCEDDHDLGYIVMRRLANVVASRLLTTRLQLLDIFGHSGEEVNV